MNRINILKTPVSFTGLFIFLTGCSLSQLNYQFSLNDNLTDQSIIGRAFSEARIQTPINTRENDIYNKSTTSDTVENGITLTDHVRWLISKNTIVILTVSTANGTEILYPSVGEQTYTDEVVHMSTKVYQHIQIGVAGLTFLNPDNTPIHNLNGFNSIFINQPIALRKWTSENRQWSDISDLGNITRFLTKTIDNNIDITPINIDNSGANFIINDINDITTFNKL